VCREVIIWGTALRTVMMIAIADVVVLEEVWKVTGSALAVKDVLPLKIQMGIIWDHVEDVDTTLPWSQTESALLVKENRLESCFCWCVTHVC
jgi:hypothetical protein